MLFPFYPAKSSLLLTLAHASPLRRSRSDDITKWIRMFSSFEDSLPISASIKDNSIMALDERRVPSAK